MLTTGRLITRNDSYSGTVSTDNIVRHLLTAGKTWKAYVEGLPSVGYTSGNRGVYLKHHNPFAFFTDVINSNSERRNLVPFTQFSSDLNNHLLPNYSFITPNSCNDAHDCSLAVADSWLKKKIGPLIANTVRLQNLWDQFAPRGKLRFRDLSRPPVAGFRAQIVVETRLDGELFLLLSAPQDFFAATVIDIGGRQVADAFVVAPLVVVLDELRHRPVECFRTAVDQHIQPGLQRLVEALQLAVGLGMMRRTPDVADRLHAQVILQHLSDVARPVVGEQPGLVLHRNLPHSGKPNRRFHDVADRFGGHVQHQVPGQDHP